MINNLRNYSLKQTAGSMQNPNGIKRVDTNQTNGLSRDSFVSKNQKKQNVSFGMIDPITAILAAIALLITGEIIKDYIVQKIDEYRDKKRKKYLEGVEVKYGQEIRDRVDRLSKDESIINAAKTFKIKPYEYASQIVTSFFKDATLQGEKGLKKVIGRLDERIKIEREVISPLVASWKGNKHMESTIPNGMVFYGPPGSGKTKMVEAIGEQLKELAKINSANVEYVPIKLSRKSADADKNIDLISNTFDAAEKRFKESKTYTLIHIDDLDKVLIVPGMQGVNAELVDRVENCAQKGVIWAATANDIKNFDKALLRHDRCEMKMPLGAIEDFHMADVLNYYLIKGGYKQDINYSKVLDTMQEKKLKLLPIEVLLMMNSIKNNTLVPGAKITTNDILKAMSEISPIMDEDEVDKFLKDKNFVNEIK